MLLILVILILIVSAFEIIFVSLFNLMEKLGSLTWFKFSQPIKIKLSIMKVSNLNEYI